MNDLPRAERKLPQLFDFVRQLGSDYRNGRLQDEATAEDRIRAFYTVEIMARIDRVVQGWEKMASYHHGMTLIHVTNVLAALPYIPAFQQADADTQTLARWVVLFHDLQKEPVNGQRDWRHGFRSAALTGLSLRHVGFDAPDPLTDHDLKAWAYLTDTAITPHPVNGQPVHDHTKLPEIVDGIDRVFGVDTPAALVVKAVLFHMSVASLAAWPPAVVLTEAETRRYLTPRLLPLLKIMMLGDNASYNILDPATIERERVETEAVFQWIASLHGMMDVMKN